VLSAEEEVTTIEGERVRVLAGRGLCNPCIGLEHEVARYGEGSTVDDGHDASVAVKDIQVGLVRAHVHVLHWERDVNLNPLKSCGGAFGLTLSDPDGVVAPAPVHEAVTSVEVEENGLVTVVIHTTGEGRAIDGAVVLTKSGVHKAGTPHLK